MTPTQIVAPMKMFARPRYLAGIISSIADTIATCSPPTPKPAMNRHEQEPEARRNRGQQVADDKHTEGDEEQFPAAEEVGEPGEDQRAEHLPDQVQGGQQRDLRGAQAQRTGTQQHHATLGEQLNLHAVEEPGRAQPDEDHGVERGPRQPVKSGRHERPECGRRWILG